MSYMRKDISPDVSKVKKWEQWEGTWQEYLAYLATETGKDGKPALSTNFICRGGVYKLRDGYEPEDYMTKKGGR